MITLDQLLESRDRRAVRQRELLEAFPEHTLVCLTVQLPGSVKRSELSLAVGHAGLKALLRCFGPVLNFDEVRDLETGYEVYLILSLPAHAVKRQCVQIEETHPLGRLMDIDVLASPLNPISREAIGEVPRRCLLCGNEVRYCMRARTHTTEELLARIAKMVGEYGA